MARPRSSLLLWLPVACATIGGGFAAAKAGLPSSYMFAALIAGLAAALLRPGAVSLPHGAFGGAQAVTGVVLGTYLHSSTLTALGSRWVPVVAVSALTLALTIVAGLALARTGRLDRPTASLGMVAGGASGIVAMADELGADGRLVAFMQYLRVLLIVLATPVLVSVAFPSARASGAAGVHDPIFGSLGGWGLTVGVAAAGAAVGPRLRLPAASLLGPLILAGALTLLGLTGGLQVPPLAREAGFAVIGLQIGLRFERGTVKRIAGLLVPVVATIAVLVVACFGLAWLLTVTANVSLLDAYLATTPGGLYAVLPIAVGSGADSTFVLAVQGLRLFVMLLAAPAVVRRLMRPRRVAAA